MAEPRGQAEQPVGKTRPCFTEPKLAFIEPRLTPRGELSQMTHGGGPAVSGNPPPPV